MGFSLTEIFNELVTRVHSGPFQFRFIVQPATAILLGARDGFADAKLGSAPFIHGLLFRRQDLKPSLKSALRRLQIPILFATVLDAIAQYLMFGYVRPITALLVGTLLMGLPYSAARGISNRLRSRRRPVPSSVAPYRGKT